jgi:benzodiazapine receptor
LIVSKRQDRLRAIAVAATAIAQVIASPLTTLAIGPSSDTGAISDDNISPVTPAGYAFAIWGLIYLGCIALAVYQVLPDQQHREVHRRTGWWLVGAFTASAIWIPTFGSRLLWLAQVVLLALVGCLAVAASRLAAIRPAATSERILLRLPVMIYLGWVVLASAAGFGTTFRSLGLPEAGDLVTVVSLILVAVATVAVVIIVLRLTAVAGFVFAACWALIAVAVGTYDSSVRFAAIVSVGAVLIALIVRSLRTRRAGTVLLG